MANFTAPLLQQTLTTAFKGAGSLWAFGVVHREMIYEIECGHTGPLASTDCQVQWDVSRFSVTASIVGTAVIPALADPADVSPTAQFLNGVTTEQAYTGAGAGAALKQWGINQRGSYRWRALDDGDNIIVAATAGTGIGVRTLSTSFASSAVGSISFVER